MKKLFYLILVLGLLSGGVAGAEISKYQCSTNEGHLFNFDLDKNSKILIIHEKYNTWKKFKTTKLEITFIDDKILVSGLLKSKKTIEKSKFSLIS